MFHIVHKQDQKGNIYPGKGKLTIQQCAADMSGPFKIQKLWDLTHTHRELTELTMKMGEAIIQNEELSPQT